PRRSEQLLRSPAATMKPVWKWLVVLLAGCQPALEPGHASRAPGERAEAPEASRGAATLDDRMVDFQFDGGQLEFELYRAGSRIQQVVRNRYAVAVTIRWTVSALDNLEPLSALEGTAVLPAARAPLGAGEPVAIPEP